MAELSGFERRAVEIAREWCTKPVSDAELRVRQVALPSQAAFVAGWLRGREDGLREAAEKAAYWCGYFPGGFTTEEAWLRKFGLPPEEAPRG